MELKHYGGNGYDGVKEDGVFEVKTDRRGKLFSSLSDARQYYDRLNEGKALWDLTRIPELLEAHTLT